MKRVAFLTADQLEGYVIDDDLSHEPLRRLGWEVETVSWRRADRDWSKFDGVIIRSTWDYQRNLPAFLASLQRIAGQTRLANPLDLIRWNSDKIYLRGLKDRGAPIVPTTWGSEPIDEEDVAHWFDEFQTRELVIKPTVSANAERTVRLRKDDPVPELAQIFAGRDYMVQPFLRSIVAEGEFSLFYFAGRYSHAILKTPKRGDFRVQEEHGGVIGRAHPSPELARAAEKVMQLLDHAPLYARADFARHEDEFVLMELELIEPSLYLRMALSAPARFATAIDRWLTG